MQKQDFSMPLKGLAHRDVAGEMDVCHALALAQRFSNEQFPTVDEATIADAADFVERRRRLFHSETCIRENERVTRPVVLYLCLSFFPTIQTTTSVIHQGQP